MGRLIKAIFISCLVIFMPLWSMAATIHVPADQMTIQAGMDVAGNADTVMVAAGTYVENIDFKGRQVVVISVDGPNVTTIRASNTAEATVRFVGGEPKGAGNPWIHYYWGW